MKSSLRADGTRDFVYPADVRGRFAVARKVVFWVLMALYVSLPWIQIGGHPAVFLDVAKREFFLFGAVFNAQDMSMTVFLFTGAAFALVFITAVLGRVWCGWGCPQTVFLEGLYRPIERLVEGPRETRKRRKGFDRMWRKVIVHTSWIVLSLALAHMFLAYFVSVPRLFGFAHESPTENLGTFLFVMVLAGILYFDLAWFREQFCVVLCPYGRMQSVLLDVDSLVVGYDEKRGEPRGKAADPNAGDCVDCGRCVVVCPTGIDIRNGLQMDCLACTACIDACDEIMDRLKRPRGLIRYDSQAGLAGAKRRFWRPRLFAYIALGVLGAAASGLALHQRRDFGANLLRVAGAPYALDDARIRNAFHVHLVNKHSKLSTFELVVDAPPNAVVLLPLPRVELKPLQTINVPFFVSIADADYRGEFPVQVRVKAIDDEDTLVLTAPFLGPAR